MFFSRQNFPHKPLTCDFPDDCSRLGFSRSVLTLKIPTFYSNKIYDYSIFSNFMIFQLILDPIDCPPLSCVKFAAIQKFP